ncbi:DUF1566 domain-containing protein [Thermodesulfobacteriota bacterium]
MRKCIGLFVAIIFLLSGCSSPEVEDSPVFKPEEFKRYEKPEIIIEDSLVARTDETRNVDTPETKVQLPDNSRSALNIVKDPVTGLEWVVGPDKDTTWDQARNWVEGLPGGGWRMPALNELKTLYKEGVGTRNMIPLLKTTGWYVWSGETGNSTTAAYFFFEWGIDGAIIRSFSTDYRGFAVRETQK